MTEGTVRAAGGVVVRDSGSDREVVVVHRPKYDDWTLPKGKALPGESDEACAVREVEEETGLRCTIERGPASVRYHDAAGRPKVARYWLMRAVAGELGPANEIDDARWLALGEADRLLTYERDREVLWTLAGG